MCVTEWKTLVAVFKLITLIFLHNPRQPNLKTLRRGMQHDSMTIERYKILYNFKTFSRAYYGKHIKSTYLEGFKKQEEATAYPIKV